ncbi:glycosyltransferase [Streptococcus iniae]|nr:glycosyltransferase [Streptococcus iniae]
MYKGKRFLLTHIWLRGFSGAEINILELATYLKKEGTKVEVFTFLASSPMIEEFQKRDISVIDDINYPFDINCYDVIFSAQNIIPSAIVNALGKKQEKCPKFIFIHMAALKEHVLEQPYIYGLEEKLSSATLAISEEIVQKNLKRFFKGIPNLQYYPNPVPEEYALQVHEQKTAPESILVISNHPPKEVMGIKTLLNAKGIKVDFFGVWSDHYQLVSPDLIAGYDCVIGIGKNVQYCLAMGKPIYVYDHFKGPGYLTAENIEQAAFNNFSGRGFEKCRKTSQEIVSDLLAGYQSAQSFQKKHIEEYRNRYTISNNMSRIFSSLESSDHPIDLLEKQDIEYINAINLLIQSKIVGLENDVANLWEGIHRLESIEKQMKSEREDLLQQLEAKNQELASINASRMFKFCQVLWKVKAFIFPNKTH